jgi:hypothetical protein
MAPGVVWFEHLYAETCRLVLITPCGQEERARGVRVTPGSTDLLVPTVDRLRETSMNYRANLIVVDPQSKCGSGDDDVVRRDDPLPRSEPTQDLTAVLANGPPSNYGEAVKTLLPEPTLPLFSDIWARDVQKQRTREAFDRFNHAPSPLLFVSGRRNPVLGFCTQGVRSNEGDRSRTAEQIRKVLKLSGTQRRREQQGPKTAMTSCSTALE